jgi:hypothetical protein
MNTWLDMVEFPRRMAGIAIDTGLQLRYTNIKDADAALFGIAWRDSLNGGIPLILPAALLAGVNDTTLKARLNAPKGLVPIFSQSSGLRIEAVKAGRSTVTCSIVFQLRGIYP